MAVLLEAALKYVIDNPQISVQLEEVEYVTCSAPPVEFKQPVIDMKPKRAKDIVDSVSDVPPFSQQLCKDSLIAVFWVAS